MVFFLNEKQITLPRYFVIALHLLPVVQSPLPSASPTGHEFKPV